MTITTAGGMFLRRFGREALAQALRETRDSTWQALDALEPAHWTVPRRGTLNPPLWEIGHVGWFQEYWCLRRDDSNPPRAMHPSTLAHADRWFDSARVAHADRWSLDLPPRERIRDWVDEVLEAALARLREMPDTDEALYWHRLALVHERFHVEAFGYTWQALGYRQPGPLWNPPAPMRLGRDASLPGGSLELGSRPDDGFVFDNEQWAHPVEVAGFEISVQPATNAEFLQFVEAGGYRDAALWPADVFARMQAEGRIAPRYWRRIGPRWQQRWFDDWIPLEPYAPVMQVDAFEAQAWCTWAGRRLPTEAEWEYAALHCEDFEWGDTVWEWTASPFLPYPGFSPGPYRDYSQPWFGDHRVVRGGSFATPAYLADPKLRNFYRPERGDVFVGFRSCALR